MKPRKFLILAFYSFLLLLLSCGRIPTATPVPTLVNSAATETVIAARIIASITAAAHVLQPTPEPTLIPTLVSTMPTDLAPTLTRPRPILTWTTVRMIPSSTPPPSRRLYPAPAITSQSKDASIRSEGLYVSWSFPSQLSFDEWFEITGWKEGKSNDRHSMHWTQELRFLLDRQQVWDYTDRSNIHALSGLKWIAENGSGQYNLSIRVIRGKEGKLLDVLSPESQAYPFKW